MKPKTNGALLELPDYRNLPAAGILPDRTVTMVHTKMSDIEHWNQAEQGDCVPHAHWKIKQALKFWSTGEMINPSRRFSYALDKQTDGLPNIQGTLPSIEDKNQASFGSPDNSLIDDNPHVSFEQFIDIPRTDAIQQAAIKNLQGLPYLDVKPSFEDIAQALQHCKLLAISVRCGVSWYPGISPLPFPSEMNEWHRIIVTGIIPLANGRTKIEVFGSWGEQWGENGNGWFYLEDYVKFNGIRDIRGYYNVPQEIVDEVKRLPKYPAYTFTRNLKYGETSDDVKALQDCLKSLGFLPLHIPSTSYYGDETAKAVLEFQIFYRTSNFVLLSFLKGHSAGPLTIADLNELFSKKIPTSKVDDWCHAIQQFEGWFPGSTSYKNNNPGNLKYVGQRLAIDKDSRGFCIFLNYNDGYTELRNMLTNAATGRLAPLYRADMTVLEFYMKYAPPSDNNPTNAYASFVAKALGVTVDTPIKKLLG